MDNVHKRVAVLFVIGEKTQSLKALQQTKKKKKKTRLFMQPHTAMNIKKS